MGIQYSDDERKELMAACASRIRELDKVKKTCEKASMEKSTSEVSAKIDMMKSLHARIAQK